MTINTGKDPKKSETKTQEKGDRSKKNIVLYHPKTSHMPSVTDKISKDSMKVWEKLGYVKYSDHLKSKQGKK